MFTKLEFAEPVNFLINSVRRNRLRLAPTANVRHTSFSAKLKVDLCPQYPAPPIRNLV